jgi:hypothetical protein
MSLRIFAITLAIIFSGCALQGCSLLSHVSDCPFGVSPQSHPRRCMTYAEYQGARGVQRRPYEFVDYKTAREKQRRSQAEAGQNGDYQADVQYNDLIP